MTAVSTPRASAASKEAPSRSPAAALRLAYLTNLYPLVSHTFIRRELLEMERRGASVLRLSIRKTPPPVDPIDQAEAAKTVSCLGGSPLAILVSVIAVLASRPLAFVRGFRLALDLARRSDRRLRHAAYLAEACHLLRVVRRERIQHLHVHFGTNPAAVAILMRRMGGPPYSMTIHGPNEFDAPESLSLAAKVRDSAFTVAITDFCAAQLKRWVEPEQWHKIHVVGCTVGESFFDAAAPADPASRTVVCVGRLSAQKGHFTLLEAFADVVRSGVDGKLVLAGDGELRAEIERGIAAAGLGGRVEITGWIDEAEIRRQLLASRALVMASFAEGLPMVIMEAMALGRPVIATAVAGIPELVRHGENGWLVTAGRADQLADAVREVLAATGARLDAMGRAGCEAVRRTHHTRTEGERLDALFREAVSRAN